MSETKQPDWEFVANLGDVNAADYGAFLVYRDRTGVYQSEAEVYEANEDETGGTMYRFILEPPQFKTCSHGGGSCPGYPNGCPEPIMHDEWWVDKLADVAETVGDTQETLRAYLDSEDPIQRGAGYQALTGYFGAHEFDHYPVTLTEAEAQERYKDIPNLTRESRRSA